MRLWLIVAGMVAVTYSARLLIMAWLGHGTLPDGMQGALKYVPPSVLAAIIFPALLMPQGTLNVSPGNLRLMAGIVAALVAWRTRNVLLSIGVGMVLLWLLQALLP